ncbi:MAG: phosphodiester glycosidase family protein [Bacteroidota bacterium]
MMNVNNQYLMRNGSWKFLVAVLVGGMVSLGVLPQQVLSQDTNQIRVDTIPMAKADTQLVRGDVFPDSLQMVADTAAKTPISQADSLLLALLEDYQRRQSRDSLRIDSLLKVNTDLALTARRRLNMDMHVGMFRRYHFQTCTVDPQKIDIQLFNPKGKRFSGQNVHTFESLEALARKNEQELVFAMNAGMFERNRQAKGLLILNGQEFKPLDPSKDGYGNFYMQPNGVFALDSSGKAYVVKTGDFLPLRDTIGIRYATQSGPMMVIGGQINPKFNDGSPNRHIRNAVGVTPDNQVIFAISEERVTFFELSSYMIQLGCTDVLYLDGAISQAYFSPLGLGSLQAGSRLGPIIAIMK